MKYSGSEHNSSEYDSGPIILLDCLFIALKELLSLLCGGQQNALDICSPAALAGVTPFHYDFGIVLLNRLSEGAFHENLFSLRSQTKEQKVYFSESINPLLKSFTKGYSFTSPFSSPAIKTSL